MNLGTYFDRATRQHRDKIAIIDGDTVLSFQELGQRATRLANALVGLGVEKGQRAAILMPNCHHAIEIDAALFKTGTIKVPLNARVSPREIHAMLKDSGASVIFVHKTLAHIPMEYAESDRSLRTIIVVEGDEQGHISYDDFIEGADASRIDASPEADDIYSLNYTSGTSGVLKAAMLTHRNWIHLTRAIIMRTGSDSVTPGVVGYVAPITHAAGGSIMANLVRGSTNILYRQFDPDRFLHAIEEQRITDVLLVPVMINMLLASPEVRKCDLSSLQSITYGAAPMAPERIRLALEIFGPILSQGYGQTESTAIISSLNKADHLAANDPTKVHRLASAGQPGFDCDVRIVDEDDREVATGEVGEIVVRGDNVMKGYWNAPELTRETIRDGWLHTRDMGRFDDDGYLYLVDRKSDMIITGGFNVYPTEVENVLYQHPAVYEAAVVSVPDPKWGEAIKAVVVLKAEATATSEELIEFCRGSLAAFKAPKSVEFRDELPKSAVGKILRRVIRESYWQAMDRRIS
jgi:acyl-CoA synthetase (AMP-forming)/AMP-acid ligase II